MIATTVDDPLRASVRKAIHEGAALNVPYLLMNIFAAIIACYGLFENSPAVIIGAMIVAMLLGPILGISLALADSDFGELFRALSALIAGTASVMVTAFILGLIHRDIPITSEIMARTAPNLLDLMIGVAGGAAGAYATVSPRLSVAFIGVAVATALVPPLAAASILFAHGEYALGGGALLLAFTNMVAIQFASAVVLWATGFRQSAVSGRYAVLAFLKRDALGLGVLAALGILLARTLDQAVEKQAKVEKTLSDTIDALAGSYVTDVRFTPGDGTTIVRAVMRAPIPPSVKSVATLAAQLPAPPDGTRIDLRIRFVETMVITPRGVMFKDLDVDPAGHELSDETK